MLNLLSIPSCLFAFSYVLRLLVDASEVSQYMSRLKQLQRTDVGMQLLMQHFHSRIRFASLNPVYAAESNFEAAVGQHASHLSHT